MKYIKIKIVVGVLLSLACSGCSDWLRIYPIDSVLENQVFATEATSQAALNGIYLSMAKNSSYGKELTCNTVELLAQQYAIRESAAGTLKYYMNSYNYGDAVTVNMLSSIWSTAYSNLLSTNNFITQLSGSNAVPEKRKNLMLGEAYALRAFMHLDLLRLFGPVYATDSTSLSIPYYTQAGATPMERESASVVMGKILADIDLSLEYLAEDPVIQEGTMIETEDNLSDSQRSVPAFFRNRHLRLNYYAVSALKARALMYRGNKEAAAAVALKLLNETRLSEHFPWVDPADVIMPRTEDRIAFSEVLFGIDSSSMYSIWESLFAPKVGDAVFLGQLVASTNYAFDITGSAQLSTSTDFRSKNWEPYDDANYLSTSKFKKTTTSFHNWYFQPLIRKTELYYILAEAKSDWKPYMDEVRLHRGLKALSDSKPTSSMETELLLEHMREFQGEGQLFFFYKRRNYPAIRSGSKSGTIAMDANTYLIPIPQAELDN